MKRNTSIPDGTSDIIFKEAEALNSVSSDIMAVYRRLGYGEVKTPTLEYYDAFNFDAQPIAQETMYKLTDNNGRLAVLRPDNTTPSARLAATKLKNEALPLKICYNQNVYRINSDYSGKKNEHLQSGIEIIGGDRFKSDIFFIETAFQVLESLRLDYKLEIGNSAFISKMPQLFGGLEVFDEAAIIAGDNKEALDVLNYTRKLYNVFCNAGYGDKLIVDLGIVHKIDYYTGCVISGYVEGVGESVLVGGRYDTLIGNFGVDVPATGFALNVNKVAEARVKKYGSAEEQIIDCLIFYDADNFAQAKQYMNTSDERCELSCFDTLEASIAFAKEKKIKKVVQIGENNVIIV